MFITYDNKLSHPVGNPTDSCSSTMTPLSEPRQPDAWQQNAVFTELLQAPAAKQAFAALETHLKPIFNSHALYSLQSGQLTVKLQCLTSLLIAANLLPHLTPHDFKLGLHLAITPSLSQSASPCKGQPLQFDAFVNAVAFCAFYYPPQKDPSQIPRARVLDQSVLNLGDVLNIARERLVAAAESPRSITAKMASPASTLVFATPYSTLPEDSPAETVTSGISSSPGTETWYTPAPAAIRTKLFHRDLDEPLIAPDLDDETENTLLDIGSRRMSMSEECRETSDETSKKLENRLSPPESLPESSLETGGNPIIATPCSKSGNKTSPCEDTKAPVSLDNQLLNREKMSPQVKLETDSNTVKATDKQNIEDAAEAPGATQSPSTCLPVADTLPVETPTDVQTDPETTERGTPESAPTNVSLAPSTALSNLPSPDGHFESPHLLYDAESFHASSSVEPKSSRKLSFSDSEDESESSSFYENGHDGEDARARINNAFDNSRAVEDYDDCEDPRSDMLSPYSPCPYVAAEDDTVVLQTMMEEDEYKASPNKASSTMRPESQADMASQVPVTDPTISHVPESEIVISESEDSGNEVEGDENKENNPIYEFDVTQDINLNEPKIAMGLPADAFSEAGCGILSTPFAHSARSRLCDTDMEYDDEDHTLLFDDGNDSDGSELSMGTRETMRKLVEDHLSLHGTASSKGCQSGSAYAEDEVFTPDRESHVAFTDGFTRAFHTIVEDGPFASEQAETKRSRMTDIETRVACHGPDAEDGTKRLTLTTDATGYEVDGNVISPMLGSQKGSFSSDITPDGLNLIKKQLVLPEPFVAAGSTVGSSVSSGAGTGTRTEQEKEENETAEDGGDQDKGIVAIAEKKDGTVRDDCVAFPRREVAGCTMEGEMMHVMRETLETCRVLREEVSRRQGAVYRERESGRVRRWVELGLFGMVVVVVTLLLVERRIQRGVFMDVLV